MKQCHFCKELKQLDQFSKCKSRKDGYQTRCKLCIKGVSNNYYQDNKNKLISKTQEWKKQHPNYDNNYYQNNKEKINNKNRDLYNLDSTKFKKWSKKYYIENREHCINLMNINHERINSDPMLKEAKRLKINEYNRKKYSENKYKFILRNQIKNIKEKLNTPKNKKLVEELNYTPLDFKIHIENQLQQNMNWDNIGNFEGSWNIDHKIPITWFQNKTPFHIVNNLENLQPLWRDDNLSKSNNYSDKISLNYYNLCKDYILEEKLKLIKI